MLEKLYYCFKPTDFKELKKMLIMSTDALKLAEFVNNRNFKNAEAEFPEAILLVLRAAVADLRRANRKAVFTHYQKIASLIDPRVQEDIIRDFNLVFGIYFTSGNRRKIPKNTLLYKLKKIWC